MSLDPGEVPNPHIAFAWLTIAGVSVTVDDFTGRPRHLESFHVRFGTEQIGTFEFVLFDPLYDFIESLVAQSHGQCTFQFGYTTGATSPVYSGFIMEYVPQFLMDGIRIHVKGMALGLNCHKKIKTRAWKGKKISEIVTEIATDNGFKPVVDTTNKVEVQEDLDTTEQKDKIWQQHHTDLNFILTKLQRQAERASDGASGYVLYFDYEKSELHFHPPKNEEAPVRTFKWREKMKDILSFEPHYNGGLLASLLWGSSSQAPSTDLTNTETQPNLKSQTVGGGGGPQTDPSKTKTEKPSSEVAFQSNGRDYSVQPDQYFGLRAAKYWWYRYAWIAAFTGTLNIVGNPLVKPFKKYDIQMQKPDGSLHWTSGLYWCNGIEHSINGGEYQTNLSLWRTGAKGGEISPSTIKG